MTPFQRRYVSYVKRCDELERKLRFFHSEIDKFELEIASAGNVDAFLNDPGLMNGANGDAGKPSGAQLLETLEGELGSYESQLRELNSFSEKLTNEYNEKVELQEVLEKARRFFLADGARLGARFASDDRGPATVASTVQDLLSGDTLGNRPDLDMRFSSITGVVSSEERQRFERMIFRATRGNCYTRFAPIEQPITDPQTGTLVEKSVFIIFYKSQSIEVKLKKICDAFGAHRYVLPDMDEPNAIST